MIKEGAGASHGERRRSWVAGDCGALPVAADRPGDLDPMAASELLRELTAGMIGRRAATEFLIGSLEG